MEVHNNDNEIEYSNVGYFDRQTVGEEGTDDANEWLSVDIGDVLEEEAAAKELDENRDQKPLDADTTVVAVVDDGSGLRPFIYDSCPSSSSNPGKVPAKGLNAETSNQTEPVASMTEDDIDESDLKISFMNFKAGSIALFVPVDASKKVWMAFHSNKPNRFLSQQSLDVFLSRRGANSDKTRILARIVYIEEHVAGHAASNSGSINSSTSNNAKTGTNSKAAVLHHQSNAPSTTSTYSSNSNATSTNSTTAKPTGPASASAGSVVRYDSERNPYNLQPGTVYYECHAEPIIINVTNRKAGGIAAK